MRQVFPFLFYHTRNSAFREEEEKKICTAPRKDKKPDQAVWFLFLVGEGGFVTTGCRLRRTLSGNSFVRCGLFLPARFPRRWSHHLRATEKQKTRPLGLAFVFVYVLQKRYFRHY